VNGQLRTDAMRKLGSAVIVLLLSCLGGAIGAALWTRTFPRSAFDWGTFLGAVVAAIAAYALANLLGLRDYARRQERDEVSRRFVDEGFDRFGRDIAAAYGRAFSNLYIVNHACSMAMTSSRRAEAILTQLDTEAPVESYESYRITLQIAHLDTVSALITAVADLRDAHEFCCYKTPLVLHHGNLQPEAGDPLYFLRYVRALVKFHKERLQLLRHQVPVAIAAK